MHRRNTHLGQRLFELAADIVLIAEQVQRGLAFVDLGSGQCEGDGQAVQCVVLVWDLGVKPLIVRRGTEHGSGLGTQRWGVEGEFAHLYWFRLHWFRRLRIRWAIRVDIHQAFRTLGCALIRWRRPKSRRRVPAVPPQELRRSPG